MVNSRLKGNNAERAVIKILSKHFPYKFERRSMGMDGADVICSDPAFKYAVEVKHHKTVRAIHLLIGNNKMLSKWWLQAACQASEESSKTNSFIDKVPLLVVKCDGKWFCTEMSPKLCHWVQFEKWCENQV